MGSGASNRIFEVSLKQNKMTSAENLCTALSGYECSFCDQNLTPWMSREEAEKPEAMGGAPDCAGVYVYGVYKGDVRVDVIFIGRSNSSIRAQILADFSERDSNLHEQLIEEGENTRVRFAVNDDDSGCSESDMICEHWKTARKLPKYSRKWPDRQGSIEQ